MPWHIIIADMRGLGVAEANLKSLGHDVYYPKEKISLMRLNKRISIERPLLYKYLFIYIPPDHDLYAVRTAAGVYRIVNDIDGKPAEIAPKLVERFRRQERYGQFDQTKRGKGPLSKGEHVMVLEGPFERWAGVVERCGLSRARVTLAGKMTIEFPVEILAPV